MVIAAIVIPLHSAIREVGRNLVTGGTLYFGLLGLGFMLVEIGLLQRLSLYLGHPVRALSVVLFSLILSAGAGSWLSERVRLDSRVAFAAGGGSIGLCREPLRVAAPASWRRSRAPGMVAREALCHRPRRGC
jgi:hypothetical protein